MYNHVNSRSGQKAPLVADDVYEIIMKVSLSDVFSLFLVWSVLCNLLFE